MGGLTKRDGSLKYVKLTKEGKFQFSKDDETLYDELEGTLVDLYLKDEEFKGTPMRKLYIALKDGTDKYVFSIIFESSYASTFINFLKNADLSQPINIVPRIDKDKETGKERRALLVSQDGTFLKSFYRKDSGNEVPAMKKIKVNKKEVWDKTDYLDFYENLIVNEFRPKLQKSTTTITQMSDPDAEDNAPIAKPWEKQEVIDDLPF